MPDIPIGETAALLVSVLWTGTSILFTIAGKRIGAFSLNAIRTLMAVGFLMTAQIALFRTPLPGANAEQWAYMGVSGVIGLAIGDFGYFGALIYLGPRRGVILMALAPIFSVVSAVVWLGEVPSLLGSIGITLTLAGVFWVIMEREDGMAEVRITVKEKAIGTIAGLIGAAGQGIGLVLSKIGMVNAADDPNEPLHAISATLIRMLAAVLVLWAMILFAGRSEQTIRAFKDNIAMKAALGGTIIGPFLGVTLSMVAVTYTIAGVAATLMSLMPVLVIPVIWVLYGQRTTPRSILGAFVAVVGVAILFLR